MTTTLRADVVPVERRSSERTLLEQAFNRAAGSPLVGGNSIRLLRNASENYPAWLEAIAAAERTIHFETYIIWDDDAGKTFVDALSEKARAGVRVRLIYDWLGAIGKTRRSFWDPLTRAGAEVRCFNPPRLAHPLGWLHRDHRKALIVDGRVAFVSGLCVGQQWVGDTRKGTEPWRDTGVDLRGPAVDMIEQAFSRAWSVAGPSDLSEDPSPDSKSVGTVAVRVVASEPWSTRMLRLDVLMAGAARERLWLTDAYFAGTPEYVQALRAAAADGVDVRLLVPGSSDIPLLRPISRAGYRPLLECGVRVYEWRGSMLHAKTAVVDDHWARVGSSNLNIASWIGNWELDVAVDDRTFGAAMAAMYLVDLGNATEIVLSESRIVDRRTAARPSRPALRGGVGSAGRLAAGALRLGNTASAMITERRVLGLADARAAAMTGVGFLVFAVIAFLWPTVVAIPLGVLIVWLGIAMVAKAHSLRKQREEAGKAPLRVVEAESGDQSSAA